MVFGVNSDSSMANLFQKVVIKAKANTVFLRDMRIALFLNKKEALTERVLDLSFTINLQS